MSGSRTSRTGTKRFGLVLIAALAIAAVFGSRSVLKRVKAEDTYRFDPRRVSLGANAPTWLDPAMARALLASYIRIAGEPFSLLDRPALAAWAKRLGDLAWVDEVDVGLRFPDAVDLSLTLRRPVAYARGAGQRLWLFGAEGRRLPLHGPGNDAAALLAATEDLPELRGLGSAERPVLDAYAEAARVAACFADQVLPRVRRIRGPACDLPGFIGVDAANAGYRRDRGAEFRVVVAGENGRPVFLEWGHAPGSKNKVLPWREKADVLALILLHHPRLAGLESADIRYLGRWRSRLVVSR